MDEALAMADWKGFEKRRTDARKRGKLRGIGISNSIEKARRGRLRGRGNPLRPHRQRHASCPAR